MKYSWYSILLENESNSGPQYGWQDYGSEMCSDAIGRLSRDLLACSALPHPTAAPRETKGHLINDYVHSCTQMASLILFIFGTSVQNRSP
jgi:hypothetical protein